MAAGDKTSTSSTTAGAAASPASRKMIDPDEYLDDPQVRKLGKLPREMQREWRDAERKEEGDDRK